MSPALSPLLRHLHAAPVRSWSVIVTVYGDVVQPRGGSLWLGTLLEIMAGLGIGGNAVRTAMSRLAADGWLERSRIGRNSFYRLTGKGADTVEAASARIYAAHPPAWDGEFHLLLPTPEGAPVAGPGYAPVSGGVMLGLLPPPPGAAIHLRARAEPGDARRLAAQAWPQDHTAEGYRRVLDLFTPLRDALREGALSDRGGPDSVPEAGTAPDGMPQGGTSECGAPRRGTPQDGAPPPGPSLSDLDALLARVLLIHEYRRIVLRDVGLPAALLPPDWPGHAARALCAEVYRKLLPPSERWIAAHGASESGALPPAAALEARFAA